MSDEEGNVVDLSTRILMSIRDEIKTMRTELRGEISGLRIELSGELSGLRTELHSEIARLEESTIRGFTAVRHQLDGVRGEVVQLNRRMDNVLETKGSDYRDHEARINALEGAVSRLSGR